MDGTAALGSAMDQLPTVPIDCRPDRCKGCPFRGAVVGTRGPEDSPFVIVGESPGSNESYKGYPFVGDSGEVLAKTLRRVGWTDEDPEPYIINAVWCMPSQNKDTDVLKLATSACHSRVEQLIKAHPRKIIIALGNAASWTTLGNYNLKITQERGKIWPSPLAELGVLTTVHPAYLMRAGTWYGKWKQDLQLAVNLYKGHDPKAGLWHPPEWAIVDQRWEFERLVEWMEDAKQIAGDIETGGPNGAGLNFQKGYILELVITSDKEDGNFVYLIPGNVLWDNEDLTKRLLGNKAKWIWQNGKFDVKFFRYEGVTEARVDHDLMLAAYTLNESAGAYDLDTIAHDWIGAPDHKNVIPDWFASQRIPKAKRDYARIPKSIRHPYACSDVSKTYHAFQTVYEAVCDDKHSNKQYHKIMIPAVEFLIQVEMKGLAVDFTRLAETDEYLQEQLKAPAAAIQKYAVEYTGQEISIGSYPQLGNLLYKHMKLGAVGSSTDDDAMIKIQRRFDHPIATKVQQWRKLSKARNTYVKNVHLWPGLDNRVHVNFNLHRTSTGRLSSSQPTNLQNWPRDPRIRGTFAAAPGKVLIECDLNQAELRCLALMSGDPTLLEVYTRNEVSIHHITSEALFGAGYTDDEKMRAKAVNFGIVYGRTAPSLAEEFDISVREAEEYIVAWLARYPKAAEFIEWSRKAPVEMRNLITVFGRKKRWGLISHENLRNSQNESANFPHQSSAHDITLLAGIECQPVLKQVWNGDFVNEIHDALYMEVDDDPMVYGPVISYVTSVMERVPKDWGLTRVPFLAEAKVGRRWGAVKGAKESGITDPVRLSEFMSEYKPTEEHHAKAKELVANYQRPLMDAA